MRVAAVRGSLTYGFFKDALSNITDAMGLDDTGDYCDLLSDNPRAVARRLREYARELDAKEPTP